MDKYSYISNAEGSAIEELYTQYSEDPNSVDKSWATFFEGFNFAKENYDTKGDIPENVQKEFKDVSMGSYPFSGGTALVFRSFDENKL